MLHPRIVCKQLITLEDAKQRVDVALQLMTKPLTNRGEIRLNEQLIVVRRQRMVGFGENHLQHGEPRAKEGPLPQHLSHHLELARSQCGLQSLASTQPCRQHQAVLHPRKYPGDRPQTLNAPIEFSACRP